MKKILTIAVASLAIAAVADSYSPQIGVTKLSLSNKNNLLPVQFFLQRSNLVVLILKLRV